MDSSQSSPQRIIRLVRPSVVILCGPAGCGKTTFAAGHFRQTQILSSDHMRALVCDQEADQRFQSQAFALLHFLISQRLAINRLCVVDSTALTHAARRSLFEVARQHQAPAALILFDVALEQCIARDAARERSAGRLVIERQFQLFEQTKSAVQGESYSQMVELNEGEMERVKIEIVFRPLPRSRATEGPVRPKAMPREPDGAAGTQMPPHR
ncbi:MAG: AAA family ATPase [Terriglobia bacterium]